MPPHPPAPRGAERLQRVVRSAGDARRRVLRHRRLLALACAGVAVLAGLRSVAPPPAPDAGVLVATRDLPAGRPLARGDLVEVRLPPTAVPAGALDPSAPPLGRLLAAPVRRGEAVTDVRLLGPGLAAAAPPGTVVAPVRLTDAGQAALLRPGDLIDLVATDPQSAEVTPLAHGVLVLAVPPARRAADATLPGRLVVLAVAPEAVARLTAATTAAYVTYAWSPG